MTEPCELCCFLRRELASARVESKALHEDRAARIAGANVAALQRAALFNEAMIRWRIAASNLEFHYANHVR